MVTIPASRLQNERDNILGEHKVEKSRQLSAAEVMRREQEEVLFVMRMCRVTVLAV